MPLTQSGSQAGCDPDHGHFALLLHVDFYLVIWTRTKHRESFYQVVEQEFICGVKSKCLYLCWVFIWTTTSMENYIRSSFYYELFKNKYTKRVQLAYYWPTTNLSLGLSQHFYYPYSTWEWGLFFLDSFLKFHKMDGWKVFSHP